MATLANYGTQRVETRTVLSNAIDFKSLSYPISPDAARTQRQQAVRHTLSDPVEIEDPQSKY